MPLLQQLFQNAHKRQYPKGQIILYQGERNNSLYRIEQGYVKVYDITAAGNEKLLLILGPGDIFPVIWSLYGGLKERYFYQTYSDSEIEVSSKSKLKKGIDSSPRSAKAMLMYFQERMRELMSRIECIDATDSRHKILQVLSYLSLAHGRKSSSKTVIIPSITHQTIADMAGLTRETTSMQLKVIQQDGVIEYHNSSITVNHRKLDRATAIET